MEVLVAVALIGVIVFLAIPNIVRVKEDSERQLAISRAEALNMATASYVQAQGATNAQAAWSGAADDPARYDLAKPYLAFAPSALSDYIPGGYAMDLKDNVSPLEKHDLSTSDGTAVNY